MKRVTREDMALTPHQQLKFDEAINILQKSKRLVIKGSAGVGKTYMVDTLIKHLSSKIKGEIYCSAPTNKAVAVLKDKVSYVKDLQFITTHSALKLKRAIDFKTGNVSFKPSFSDKYPPLKNVKIFIIDEASMLSSELLKYVEHHSTQNGTIVIFIGDDKQLNPVNEDESPVFIADYPTIELTEIVRQKGGNPIIDLSRDLKKIGVKESHRTDVGGYIYTYDEARVVATLAHINGTDELKYLGYTNAEVDRINRMTRELIYGSPSKIEENETLVFNSPFGEDYYTNQEILVSKLRVLTQEFSYISNKDGVADITSPNAMFGKVKLKVYSLNPTHVEANEFSEETWSDKLLVIHEDSEKDYNEIVTKLKFKAKIGECTWVDYYEFVEQFADLSYNHAITVHKSQGSTYKQAIVNIANLNINKNHKEKQRLLYTAVTRASELLILYKA